MRRISKVRVLNTTQSASRAALFDAEAEIAALKARVKRLEKRLSDDDDELFFTDGQALTKPQRGPKPKRSSNIYRDRDLFVRFFEWHWPKIEPLCGPKPNVPLFRRFLEEQNKPQTGQMAEVASQLLTRIEFWQEFLSNPKYRARYREDPRVLAGALAGVPEISIWRSLKLCPPSTCKVPMNDSAMRSYLRRKHPEVYKRLSASTDSMHVTPWWKEYRTRDKRLKGCLAVDLIRWWNAAK